VVAVTAAASAEAAVFAVAVFVVVAFVAAAFAPVAFAAVGDPYNQSVYQGSAGYTDQLVEQIQLRLARAGYYHSSIDGVSGNGARRAIGEYKRAHGLPEDGKIGQQLLTTMGLSKNRRTIWIRRARAVNAAKLPIWQSHIPQKVVFYRAPDEEKSIHQSSFQRLGNKSGTATVVLNECNRA